MRPVFDEIVVRPWPGRGGSQAPASRGWWRARRQAVLRHLDSAEDEQAVRSAPGRAAAHPPRPAASRPPAAGTPVSWQAGEATAHEPGTGRPGRIGNRTPGSLQRRRARGDHHDHGPRAQGPGRRRLRQPARPPPGAADLHPQLHLRRRSTGTTTITCCAPPAGSTAG